MTETQALVENAKACPKCGKDMEKHMAHPAWPGERVEREPHWWCPGDFRTHAEPVTMYADGTTEDY